MKTVVKIALGVLIAGVLLIGGCIALIGTSIDQGFKDVEKDRQAKAVSQSQIKDIKRGSSRRSVQRKLGKPENVQESNDESGRVVYLYYPVNGGEELDQWQLVFEGNKLTAKNR